MSLYPQLQPLLFDCARCPTPCDGKTVPKFDFAKDVLFAERIETRIIELLRLSYPEYIVRKTERAGYPDIEVYSPENLETPAAYLEIKAQTRTFMSVEKYLPLSHLLPSETIALNLSDLERYFEIAYKEKNIPLYIVWSLANRPCIVPLQKQRFFYQNILTLKKIRRNDFNNTRRFRRKSGEGDVVNGEHKGVTVNYHFSLRELEIGFPLL
jgi:hypothetical protein